MALPTIVLVPGAWHTSSCYHLLEPTLRALGYPTEKVSHPAIGAEPPTLGVPDDVASLRAVLSRLIDEEEKSVVLLGHSYGGIVISNASEGFGLENRQREGKKGGLVVVMYLAAFALPKGMTLYDGLQGQWLDWMKFEGEYSNPATPEQIFYHDVPSSLQKEAVASLKHSSKDMFHGAVTHLPWQNNIPCAYIFCDDDQALILPVQEQMASFMQTPLPGMPTPVLVTANLPASHSPFLSMPEKTAECIVDLVGEVMGREMN